MEVFMPDAWSNKDERKYEHIKESSLESGKSEDRAEEIAARTVNRDRREEGRTPNTTTQGTGNPGERQSGAAWICPHGCVETAGSPADRAGGHDQPSRRLPVQFAEDRP
jgi:hypothetical protein